MYKQIYETKLTINGKGRTRYPKKETWVYILQPTSDTITTADMYETTLKLKSTDAIRLNYTHKLQIEDGNVDLSLQKQYVTSLKTIPGFNQQKAEIQLDGSRKQQFCLLMLSICIPAFPYL